MLWEGDKLMYGDVSYDKAYSGDTLIWMNTSSPTGLTLVTGQSTITPGNVYVIAGEGDSLLPFNREYLCYDAAKSAYTLTGDIQQALKFTSTGIITPEHNDFWTLDLGAAFGIVRGEQMSHQDFYYFDINPGATANKASIATIVNEGVTYENIIETNEVYGLGYRRALYTYELTLGFKLLGASENRWNYMHLYQVDF